MAISGFGAQRMAGRDRKLKYFVVDVFTNAPFRGNPLAVVMNTCALATEEMQAIAREFNLSETTFVERRGPEIEREEGVRVRIFTTEEELDRLIDALRRIPAAS